MSDAHDSGHGHEEMGFFDGWNTCITQLEEFARELR